MAMQLNEILSLVGRLDDSEGEDTPRERFRRFLHDSVRDIGQVRDYVEDCLRYTGPSTIAPYRTSSTTQVISSNST